MYFTDLSNITLDSSSNRIDISGNLNVKSIETLRDGTLLKMDYIPSTIPVTYTYANTDTGYSSNGWSIVKSPNSGEYKFKFTPKIANVASRFLGIVYYNYLVPGAGGDKTSYTVYVDDIQTDFCWYMSIGNPGGGGRAIPRPLIAEKYIPPNTSSDINIQFRFSVDSGNDPNWIQTASVKLLAYQYVYNSYKIYNTAGTYTGTIPYWCKRIGILLIGGGGAGGTGAGAIVNYSSGGGGGGGGSGYTFVKNDINITQNNQNNTYTLIIGEPGFPSLSGINETSPGFSINGENTSINLLGIPYDASGGNGGNQTFIENINGRPGGTGLVSGGNGVNGVQGIGKNGGIGGNGGVTPSITHPFDSNLIIINNSGNGGKGGNGGGVNSFGTASGGSPGEAGNPGYAAIFFYES